MVLLFVSVLRRRVVMPLGWHQTPSGWWQRSIMGPRSPSETLPRGGSQQPSQPGRSQCMAEQVRTASTKSPTVATTQPRSQLLPTPLQMSHGWRVQLRCWETTTPIVEMLYGLRKRSNRSRDSRQDQGGQGVPRPCQEARVSCRGSHCQSCRTEDDFRWAGCRWREVGFRNCWR